jgi:hypothetical protein
VTAARPAGTLWLRLRLRRAGRRFLAVVKELRRGKRADQSEAETEGVRWRRSGLKAGCTVENPLP